MNEPLLQQILDQLQNRRQAASYGAVAGLVGSTPQQVMADRPRDAKHSWVVNTRTELPTDYDTSEMDSELLAAITARGVIRTPEDLETWLAASPKSGAAPSETDIPASGHDALADELFAALDAEEATRAPDR